MAELIEGAAIICPNFRGTGKTLFGRVAYFNEDFAIIKPIRFGDKIDFGKLQSISKDKVKVVDTRKAKIRLAEKKKVKLDKKNSKKNTYPIHTTNSGTTTASSKAVITVSHIGLGGSEQFFEGGVYHAKTNRWYKSSRAAAK